MDIQARIKACRLIEKINEQQPYSLQIGISDESKFHKRSISEMSENIELKDIIHSVFKIPGVKVNRLEFLAGTFCNEEDEIFDLLLDVGPVQAGISREELGKIADHLVENRTLLSSGLSFTTGLPGGLIGSSLGFSADTIQYFSVALILSQELAYLYGEEDLLNEDGELTEDSVNKLIVYLGILFNVPGAAAAFRLSTTSLEHETCEYIPQKTLNRNIALPLVKLFAKSIMMKLSHGLLRKSAAKAIPVVSGFISGSLTYAALLPMGRRLRDVLDIARFDYSVQNFESDIEEIRQVNSEDAKRKETKETIEKDLSELLTNAQELLKAGLLTDEEFETIKSRLCTE